MPHRREVLRQFGGAMVGALAAGAVSHVARADAAARPRIKIGQIGVGHAHAGKLAVFRKSPDYEVVGLVEPDAELRGRAETDEAFRDLPWMTQEQLLNASGLQAVLVETRVRDLLNAAEACVAAGKHVHLDKPAGESLPQYRRILAAAAQHKLLVQMGYMYRYNPGVVMLRDLLKRGWLGEPFEVQTVMSKVVAPPARRSLAEYPGGIMFELGCHVIDLVVGILGPPNKVTSVRQALGERRRYAGRQHAGRVRISARNRHDSLHGLGSRRGRAAAPDRVRHRGDVPHSAARRSGGAGRAVGCTRRVSPWLPGRRVSQVLALCRRCGRHGPSHPRREAE